MAMVVFRNGVDGIVGDAVRRSIGQESLEVFGLTAEKVKPVGRSYPKAALIIFIKSLYSVVGERRRIVGIECIYLELVAVKAVEAVVGTGPKEALLVLSDGVDGVLRQPQLVGDAFQRQILPAEQGVACE